VPGETLESIFIDGFESGDTTAWDSSSPEVRPRRRHDAAVLFSGMVPVVRHRRPGIGSTAKRCPKRCLPKTMTKSRTTAVDVPEAVLLAAGRRLTSLCRRWRWALLSAGLVCLTPVVSLLYYISTRGYPKTWGPLGGFTTWPGHLIAEWILGRPVWLATTSGTYVQHIQDWALLMGANYFGWLLVFVTLSIAFRLIGPSVPK
jgi:hypothetical protein